MLFVCALALLSTSYAFSPHLPALLHRYQFNVCAKGRSGGQSGGRGKGGGRGPYSGDFRQDKDMKKAERFLVKQQTTKASKKAYKDGRKRDQLAASQVQKHIPQPGKNFAQQTIWGQNIIDVREFNVDKPKTFEFLGSYDSLESMPQFPLPEIAFLGRSNVGKSSLLNCLTQQHKALAVVSKTPGRTRLMNLFKCSDADGDICIFVDLPGYGFAKISRGQQDEISGFLRRYLDGRGALRYVTLLIDSRREPLDQDMGMASYLAEQGLPFGIVSTKVDKLKPVELQAQLDTLGAAFGLMAGPLPFSSTTGEGKKQLWRLLRRGILAETTGELSGETHLSVTDEEEEEEEEDIEDENGSYLDDLYGE